MIGRIASLLGFKPRSPSTNDDLIYFDRGPEVPAGGTRGYGTGAIFQHTSGFRETALYVNEGTGLACDFQPAGATPDYVEGLQLEYVDQTHLRVKEGRCKAESGTIVLPNDVVVDLDEEGTLDTTTLTGTGALATGLNQGDGVVTGTGTRFLSDPAWRMRSLGCSVASSVGAVLTLAGENPITRSRPVAINDLVGNPEVGFSSVRAVGTFTKDPLAPPAPPAEPIVFTNTITLAHDLDLDGLELFVIENPTLKIGGSHSAVYKIASDTSMLVFDNSQAVAAGATMTIGGYTLQPHSNQAVRHLAVYLVGGGTLGTKVLLTTQRTTLYTDDGVNWKRKRRIGWIQTGDASFVLTPFSMKGTGRERRVEITHSNNSAAWDLLKAQSGNALKENGAADIIRAHAHQIVPPGVRRFLCTLNMFAGGSDPSSYAFLEVFADPSSACGDAATAPAVAVFPYVEMDATVVREYSKTISGEGTCDATAGCVGYAGATSPAEDPNLVFCHFVHGYIDEL